MGENAQLLFCLSDQGRLVAACGLGPLAKIAKEVRVAEMLIALQHCPDPAALASPAIKLKTLLAEY